MRFRRRSSWGSPPHSCDPNQNAGLRRGSWSSRFSLRRWKSRAELTLGAMEQKSLMSVNRRRLKAELQLMGKSVIAKAFDAPYLPSSRCSAEMTREPPVFPLGDDDVPFAPEPEPRRSDDPSDD